MDFMTGISIIINWKGDTHNSILVIIYWLTKIVYHKLIKITLDITKLVEIIINVVVH